MYKCSYQSKNYIHGLLGERVYAFVILTYAGKIPYMNLSIYTNNLWKLVYWQPHHIEYIIKLKNLLTWYVKKKKWHLTAVSCISLSMHEVEENAFVSEPFVFISFSVKCLSISFAHFAAGLLSLYLINF